MNSSDCENMSNNAAITEMSIPAI